MIFSFLLIILYWEEFKLCVASSAFPTTFSKLSGVKTCLCCFLTATENQWMDFMTSPKTINNNWTKSRNGTALSPGSFLYCLTLPTLLQVDACWVTRHLCVTVWWFTSRSWRRVSVHQFVHWSWSTFAAAQWSQTHQQVRLWMVRKTNMEVLEWPRSVDWHALAWL